MDRSRKSSVHKGNNALDGPLRPRYIATVHSNSLATATHATNFVAIVPFGASEITVLRSHQSGNAKLCLILEDEQV